MPVPLRSRSRQPYRRRLRGVGTSAREPFRVGRAAPRTRWRSRPDRGSARGGRRSRLVAMLGEGASWVANVRPAGGRAVLRLGRREPALLEEVEPGERAPILRRYLEVASGARAHFPKNIQ